MALYLLIGDQWRLDLQPETFYLHSAFITLNMTLTSTAQLHESTHKMTTDATQHKTFITHH